MTEIYAALDLQSEKAKARTMLYRLQKRFNKNGVGMLKGPERQRCYRLAFGDEVEAKEKRKHANAAVEQKYPQLLFWLFHTISGNFPCIPCALWYNQITDFCFLQKLYHNKRELSSKDSIAASLLDSIILKRTPKSLNIR